MSLIQSVNSQEFYFGVDLSYVNEMESCGALYKVGDSLTDPFTMFSDYGANLVRARLWHTPSWYDNLNMGIRFGNFPDAQQTIMRAHQAGMDALLDFHLSDNWADPSHQVAPAAWNNVLNNLPLLQDSLFNYIYSTLDQLALLGTLPEIVQIGNETNRGILLSQQQNDQGWTLDWNRNSALFNAAISAVHAIEVAHGQEVKIALHIADPDAVGWYMDQFHDHGVTDFDIIGMSYYWQWHEMTFAAVGEVISSLKQTYPDKEIMILETAYPWTTMNADGANNILSVSYPGYSPFSPVRQKQWLIDLTQEVIDHGGKGVVYWEPAWVSTDCRTQWAVGSSWDNATFFNADHALIENGGIQWMSHPYDFTTGIEDVSQDKIKMVWVDVENSFLIQTDNIDLGKKTLRVYSIDGKEIFVCSIDMVENGEEIMVQVPLRNAGCYFAILESDGKEIAVQIFMHIN